MSGASLVVIGMALDAPAMAQTANTTASDVNVLNLLSPFLSLNATTVGQQTLTANLSGAISVNHFAASSSSIEATSISDKTIASGNSTAITLASGATANYGPGANLGGGLPVQKIQSTGGIAPAQQLGGLGSLGTAFQSAVAPSGATVPSVVTLLNNAYAFNSNDLGIAKFYFANGTINGTTTAVAPTGSSLPTANGYPNIQTSVYDTAYGVSITGANQNIFGDSRPSQVSPTGIIGYDPTALQGISSNPSFPSGHTTYAYTDSILIGMMAPQFYQSMLLRASEYGNSRISLGVHYPLDIIASRSFVSYDLAQLLNATGAAYTQTNVASGATPQNLNTQFQTAATAFDSYLNTQTGGCGGSLSACAANNPYNTYSAATYTSAPFVTNAGSTTASANSAIYQSRLTYGLPTLSFTLAPREQAPTGGPDASILLSTLYGGSTAAAQGLASSVGGALYGNLSTATINQIIVNTETNALAAFYGTSLSYWSRIDLYDAASYFQNVTGSVNLASGDQLKSDVTVANTGVLGGGGTITGNVAIQSGGELGVTNNGGSLATLTVNGTTALQAGSKIALTGTFLPGQTYTVLTSTGKITVDPSVSIDTTSNSNLMTAVGGRIAVVGDPTLTVTPQSNFAATATGANAVAAAAAIDTAGNAGGYGASGTAFLTNLITNNTAATATRAFNALSGEGIAGQQQAAFDAGDAFAKTALAQATYWSGTGSIDPDAQSQTIGQLHAWGSAFGGSDSLDGNATAGSATVSSNVAGFLVGGDYLVRTGLRIGAAAGYSHSDFSNSARATNGDIDAGHVALYAAQRWAQAYLSGVVEYANYGSSERRTVFGTGENGNFTGNEFLARGEAGYTLPPLDFLSATPFAGFQLATLQNDAFHESGTSAINGLNVNSRSISSDKIFLGLQMDANQLFGNSSQITPYSRIAWEHEFTPKRAISASFQALPGASFTVLGAPAAEDLARVDLGVKYKVTDAISLFAEFDGGFADRGNFYGGHGGLKFAW